MIKSPYQEYLYNSHIFNIVDRGIIGTCLEEYLGQFLFGVHNPFKSTDLDRGTMEGSIMEKVMYH